MCVKPDCSETSPARHTAEMDGCIRRVVLEPDPTTWGDLARRHAESAGRLTALLGRSCAEWRASLRCELGLPQDRLLLATGHQPGFRHPGILVKYMAIDALAGLLGADRAACVHLVVDQDDDDDFTSIDVPVRDDAGSLRAASINLDEITPPNAAVSAHTRGGSLPGAYVEDGLARMRQALARAAADAATKAERYVIAATELMTPHIAPMPLISASQLLNTQFGHALMQAMRHDPNRCADAYNRAVLARPEARIEPLAVDESRIELPLWVIDDSGNRRRAFADDLDDADINQARFRPRALLLTAIMRLAACDLFVHGSGGWIYDRATEQWTSEWLEVEMAPMTAATADVHLPLLEPHETDISVADAIHALRKFRHDPTADEHSIAPSPEKRERLLALRTVRDAVDRRRIFHNMHRRLDQLRQARPETERLMTERVERARRAQRDLAIARRRDWAFPLYPPGVIAALSDRIRANFEGIN